MRRRHKHLSNWFQTVGFSGIAKELITSTDAECYSGSKIFQTALTVTETCNLERARGQVKCLHMYSERTMILQAAKVDGSKGEDNTFEYTHSGTFDIVIARQ